MVKEKNPFLTVVTRIDDSLVRFFQKKWSLLISWPLFVLALYGLYFLFAFKQGVYDVFGMRTEALKNGYVILLVTFAVFVIGLMVLWGIMKRLSRRRVAFSFFLIASTIVMAFGFFRLYCNDDFTHDFGAFSGYGHFSVIYDIYSTGKIPPVDLTNQYYQPKFYHALMALFFWINRAIIPSWSGSDAVVSFLVGNAQYGSFTYHDYATFETGRILLILQAIITLSFLCTIITELPLKNIASNIASFLIFFTPVMWFLTFYKNNDALAFLFMVAALYAALRYRKTKSWVSIIFTAICIGLSMGAKLSGMTIAFPVALIFFLELWRLYFAKGPAPKPEKKERVRFWIQIAVFAVIVFPLGLFWPIYAKIKYDMPIGYVWDLVAQYGTDYFMYIDPNKYPAFLRIALFPSPDLFWNMWNVRYYRVSGGELNPWGHIDFNIWTAFLKTGLWSESNLSSAWPFSFLLRDHPIAYVVFGMIYAIAILVGILFVLGGLCFIVGKIIRLIKKKKLENLELLLIMAVTFFAGAIAYAATCLRYPVGCTMNARYGMILYLPIGVTVGCFIEALYERIKAGQTAPSRRA